MQSFCVYVFLPNFSFIMWPWLWSSWMTLVWSCQVLTHKVRKTYFDFICYRLLTADTVKHYKPEIYTPVSEIYKQEALKMQDINHEQNEITFSIKGVNLNWMEMSKSVCLLGDEATHWGPAVGSKSVLKSRFDSILVGKSFPNMNERDLRLDKNHCGWLF